MLKLLPLTNDYVFKRNFGYKGEEDITRVLLKDIYDEKLGIMDVKATINKNTICDIDWLERLRDKYIRDEKSIRLSGYEDGRKDGEAKKQQEIAKKMLSMKIDIELIIKATGLTKEHVEELKK